MSAKKRPWIAVSVGCPSGVGPEVSVVAASKTPGARVILVGDPATIERAAGLRRVAKRRFVLIDEASSGRKAPSFAEGTIGVLATSARLTSPSTFGKPDAEAGAAQLRWIDQATDLVTSGLASALVTGPVSKKAIATSGAPGAEVFRGHTEHLAERLGAHDVVMCFWSRELTTALVTTHLPLAKVPAAITPEAVSASIFRVVELATRLGKRRPKIVVASLNPHAGEGGLLGDEETTRIAPGIELARQRIAGEGGAADIVGPMGAETALRLTARGDFDAVVCMYHDQATIPMKVLGFGEAVNVTLGLPIVRTSVDHGTGYDVAGTREADARGMREALDLAIRLTQA